MLGEDDRKRDAGSGMWRPLSDQEGKTKYDFSCHQKDSMFSALWSMSLGSLFQRVGEHCGMMTFMPECLLFVFSERSRENETDCMEQQVPADTVLSFMHVLALCRRSS